MSEAVSTGAGSVRYAPGDTVRIDCPGHAFHGRAVEVVRDDPAVELGYEDASMIARVIFCRLSGATIGFGPEHIAGTAEAQQRRRWDAAEVDERQGELGI